jgi:murein DD-endopeptidase MepM/ murein hydrolase activator NlpD
MKKALVKIIWIFMILILLMQNSIIYALTEKEELQQEQSKINSQLKEMEKKQDELEKQKSKAMKAVENLIEQVSQSEEEIGELKKQISNLQEQITLKDEDIKQKEEEYTEQEKLLDKRLIAIYKNGETSYLDLLLSSNNMSDFLARYYSASELIECDKDLIATIKEQKAQIESEKKELENNKIQLNTSLEEQKKKNAELEKMKKEKQSYANQLTEEEKELQKEIEELEVENKRIQKEIKIAEEKYRKQLEALKNNSSSNTAGSGFFMRPVSGGTISANGYYPSSGKYHGAIDYAIPVGTKVVAAADGVVMLTQNLTGSYGTYVVIRHANGLQSYYAHGQRGSIVVSPGDTVKKGQKIMLSGNTGNSSGPHLHFEVRKSPYNYSYKAKAYGQDSRVNPLNYM